MSKESYGKWVARNRIAMGLKQTELAAAIGYAQAVISYVENGEYKRIYLDLNEKLAKFFGVSPLEGAKIYYDETDTLGSYTVSEAINDIRRTLAKLDNEQPQPAAAGWQPTPGALEGLAQVQQAQHSRRVFRFNKPSKPALNHNNNNGSGEHRT